MTSKWQELVDALPEKESITGQVFTATLKGCKTDEERVAVMRAEAAERRARWTFNMRDRANNEAMIARCERYADMLEKLIRDQ